MIRLKYERLDRGITQKQFEFLSGVPQPVICLIETGRWSPTDAELTQLARVLGVHPPSALLREVVVEPASGEAVTR